MPRLFVLSGDDLGRTHDFDRALVIGRGTDADFRVRAASVSRQHARLEPDGAGWRVVDLGSSNGTRVDGRRVDEAALTDGTVFVVGEIELRFRDDESNAAPVAIVHESAPAPRTIDDVLAEEFEEDPDGVEIASGGGALGASLEDDDDIELEGDWEEVELPTRSAPSAAAPASVAPAPSAPRRSARDDRRAAALGDVGARPGSSDPARQVLQFSRVEGSGGFLGADLAQRPAWQRYALYLVALAVMVGLAWAALEMTRTMRENRARTQATDLSEFE